MAKKSRSAGGYGLSAILIAVVILFTLAAATLIYVNSWRVSRYNMGSVEKMSSISDRLSEVNENVILLVADIGTEQGLGSIENINNSFDVIYRDMEDYENIKGHSDMETRRYHQAKLSIMAYQKKLSEIFTVISNFNYDDAKNTYVQEIYPIESTANEMLMATIELCSLNAENMSSKTTLYYIISAVVLVLFLVIGEIGVYMVSKNAKRAEAEIEAQSNALSASAARLEKSKQKMENIALTNILTGLKNRYALENDLGDRLETDQFNIGVFDLDNFRQINDTFGYEFGDEYLAAVAEKLVQDFGEVAEIYNITGNEFCFVFKDDISDSVAQKTSQKIAETMSAPYQINSILAQLTVSGSIYHYLPNDCLNIDSLLIKLDTTLHNVKMNGGNAVYTVNSL